MTNATHTHSPVLLARELEKPEKPARALYRRASLNARTRRALPIPYAREDFSLRARLLTF